MEKEQINKAMKQLRTILHKSNAIISLPKEFESYLTEEDKKLVEQNHIQLIFS
jgi:poly(3-hydroxyalkanoate) synthetase